MTPDKQITVAQTSGVGWSPYWKPARGLRWLFEPEFRRGVKIAAYKANRFRTTYYFYNNCHVCGGRYFTSRIHSQFCSDRCRQEYQRYMND